MKLHKKILICSLVLLISAPAMALAATDVKKESEKHAKTLKHPSGRAYWFGGHHDMEKRPVTYLGVHIAPIDPVVTAQLGLQKGMGLTVNHVAKDSPAEKAGLEKFDILKMLDNQIIIHPKQFQVLVRSKDEGEKITLTILRKGSELKLKATLSKRESKPDIRDRYERFFQREMPHMPSDFRHGMGRHPAERMEEGLKVQ